MKEKTKRIGIVGFGRFGRVMARYLADDFQLWIHDLGDHADGIRQIGARPASLAEAATQPVVILSVPISVLRSVLAATGPLLREGSLVIDVCSVKVRPLEWMRERLPPQVSILATHPMFGPDSAARSLEGHKIVLCPERIPGPRLAAVRAYLKSKGLVVIETDAETHDRQIAISLALTHFIGRSLERCGARPLEIDTEGYQRLLHTLGVVANDTWQLFEDMNRYNPFAAAARQGFIKAMLRIEAVLEKEPGR